MRMVSDGLMDLRLQPGRAVLAAVSLLLGVLAVIGNGLATTISREIVVAGSEQRTAKSVTYQQQLNGNISVSTVQRLTLEANRLRIDHNGGSWALLGSPARTAAGKGASPDKAQYSGLEMAVTAGDLPAVRRLPILKGNWLSDGIYPPQVVLNKAAADDSAVSALRCKQW